jgi:hypothetical protein
MISLRTHSYKQRVISTLRELADHEYSRLQKNKGQAQRIVREIESQIPGFSGMTMMEQMKASKEANLLRLYFSYESAVEADSPKSEEDIYTSYHADEIIEGGIRQLKTDAHDIEQALSRVERVSTVPVFVEAMFSESASENHFYNGALIYVGDASFTYFGQTHIGDILEDTQDFDSMEEMTDYQNLIKEIQKPGSSKTGKTLTLYTARPIKDRQMYLHHKTLYPGIFLSNDEDHVYGLANDLGSRETRDVWEVRVNSRHLMQTLTGGVQYYQVVGSNPVPVVSMSLISEGSLRLSSRLKQAAIDLVETPHSHHPVGVLPPTEEPFVGYIDFQGLQIDVEVQAGDYREKTGKDGKPWKRLMHAHYGEVRGTLSTDGDLLDVYVGPNHDSSIVVVIYQHDPDTGEYDEDKVVLGCDSIEEAIGLYKKHYNKSGFYIDGEYKAMPIGQFWRWVHDERNHGTKIARISRKRMSR